MGKVKIIRVDKQTGAREQVLNVKKVLDNLKGYYHGVDKMLEEFLSSKEEELRLQTMFAIYVITKGGK